MEKYLIFVYIAKIFLVFYSLGIIRCLIHSLFCSKTVNKNYLFLNLFDIDGHIIVIKLYSLLIKSFKREGERDIQKRIFLK